MKAFRLLIVLLLLLSSSQSILAGRYYDSKMGRFLSVDPLADKYPGWSPYNYTGGNPINRIDPNGKDWFENNDNGELRFIRGETSIEGDEWTNIGGDDLYQDWTLESGTNISEIDNITLSTEDAQRLMYVNENSLLVSQQNVIEREFTDTQNEPQMRRSATTYSTTIVGEKFTYKSTDSIIPRNAGAQNIVRQFGGVLSTQKAQYQTIIKVGQKPVHPSRIRGVNTQDVVNFVLSLVRSSKLFNKVGKKMLKKYFLLMFALIIFGCAQSADNILNQKYIKEKSFFPVNFVNHFPSKLSDKIGVSIYSVTEKKWMLPLSLIVTDKYDEIKEDSLIDSIITNSVTKYNPNDSCLLIVDRFHNQTNEFDHVIKLSSKDSTYLEQQCYEQKLPIPNFFSNENHNRQNEILLSDDFKMYVLEAKAGKYWEEENLKDGRYMPTRWKNGYSKGIAISEEKSTVIYWFIIW